MRAFIFYSPEVEQIWSEIFGLYLEAGDEVPAMVDGRDAPWQGRYGIARYDRTVVRPTPAADAARVDQMIAEANERFTSSRL